METLTPSPDPDLRDRYSVSQSLPKTTQPENQDLLCWPLLNSSDCGLQGGRVAQGTEMKKQLQRCPRSHGDQSRGRPQQRVPQ
ncbi:small integral membrane protein 41 isoform X2 [Phocoena sinus]|uniref:small integral membrane protein 41 isoform X2 n=1 Tax=Phocoena sinus TaxID=42100 RepID=UPI0013C42ED1|nr:small integral membrane protein 41 isoform X2 [Phocoena sinus]